MTTTKTYNGWTNYETWNVKLWMDNEQGSYSYWREVAQGCYDDADERYGLTRDDRAASNLADCLKSEYEDAQPDLGASVWADLLGAAMSEVNWHEIAVAMIEDVDRSADPIPHGIDYEGDDAE